MSAIQLTVPADCYNCLALHVCGFNLHPCTCAHSGGHSCAFFLVCVCVCYTDSLLSLQVISWLRREIERRKRNIQWERNKDRDIPAAITEGPEKTINMYMFIDVCMCRWQSDVFSVIFTSFCLYFLSSRLKFTDFFQLLLVKFIWITWNLKLTLN